jgi:general L-amino acid transport system permease protein
MFQVTSANLQSRASIRASPFWEPSRTPVADAPIVVEAGVDSYAKALPRGAQQLKLTAAAIVAATLVGLVIGLGRLSQNALARALCAGYVEVMRNVPVLLHVFLWYGVILGLPAAARVVLGRSVVANRGLYLAWPGVDANGTRSLVRPVVDGFEVKGGIFMAPEFFALFVGISLYTALHRRDRSRRCRFVATRAVEATAALGLLRATTLRRVVLPQALRVAMPPLTSEYLGIFKNSTLAVAVGYQDFMAISTTMLTDTGQAVEVMAIVMAFYAAVSLLVSAAMHVVEHRNMRWGLR